MYICICFIQKDTSTNLDELNLVMASVAIRTNPENITKIFNYKSVVTDEDEVEVFYFITTTQRYLILYMSLDICGFNK